MHTNDTTNTPKAVKSKQEYALLAQQAIDQTRELSQEDYRVPIILQFAQVYATLAIAAPEASAPDDYLAVCRERDVLRSALRAVHEYFQMDAEYIHPEGLVQMVAITVEPETAE